MRSKPGTELKSSTSDDLAIIFLLLLKQLIFPIYLNLFVDINKAIIHTYIHMNFCIYLNSDQAMSGLT